MKLYREDWETACRLTAQQSVPRFTDEQTRHITQLTKAYVAWFRRHPLLHNAINLLVLAFLFGVDLVTLIGGTLWIAGDESLGSAWWFVGVGIALIHGLIMYSVIIFSMHEGAAHDRIIQRVGPISRVLGFLANNASRTFFADPRFYSDQHIGHHGHFGTPEDGTFTNFVNPRRFLISLLPLSGFLDFNDFRTHCDIGPSRSRKLSVLIGTLYALPIVAVMLVTTNGWLPLLVFVLIGPWVASTLDRIRESTEHNLMSLEARHGARNLGLGFWGLLIGGGPWGQPCHLSHHLAPALPWYQQCLLHLRLKQIMTAQQRRYFTLTPFIGYPLLLWNLSTTSLRETRTKAGTAV